MNDVRLVWSNVTQRFELISDRTCARVPLEEDEVRVLRGYKSHLDERYFVLAGGEVPVRRDTYSDDVRTWRQHFRSQVPSGGRSVLVDTTTVASALDCINYGRTPGAIQLLDLALLVFVSVFYDTVLVQPHPRLERVRSIPDKPPSGPPLPTYFHIVDYGMGQTEEQIRTLLDTLRILILSDRIASGDRWGKVWADFLDLKEPPRIYLNQHESLVRSDHFSGLLYDMYFDKIISGEDLTSHVNLSTFLTAQTERAIFNDGVAGFMGIPYAATSMRLPVNARLIKDRTDLLLPGIAEQILGITRVVATVPEIETCGSMISAPFLLEVILRNATKPHEIWHEIGKLRANFTPVRKALASHETAFRQDARENSREVFVAQYSRLLKEGFRDLVDNGISVVDMATQLGTAAAGWPRGISVIPKVLKLGTNVMPSASAALFSRNTFVLFSLAQQARHLINVRDQVRTLWGEAPGAMWLNVLEFLGKASDNPVFQLGGSR